VKATAKNKRNWQLVLQANDFLHTHAKKVYHPKVTHFNPNHQPTKYTVATDKIKTLNCNLTINELNMHLQLTDKNS
jgi:hypothetical protein